MNIYLQEIQKRNEIKAKTGEKKMENETNL